jgi:hypothetical protein
MLEDVERIRGSTGSVFVRLFLGQVNVKVASDEDRCVTRKTVGRRGEGEGAAQGEL